MVLGKLTVPGRPTIWITVGQGRTALAVGAGGGCLDIFTLIYPFFPLSPSLWETARYRLKYCLKGPLNPKPTNQPKIRGWMTDHSQWKWRWWILPLFTYKVSILPQYRVFTFMFRKCSACQRNSTRVLLEPIICNV